MTAKKDKYFCHKSCLERRTYAELTHCVDLERHKENQMGRPINKRYLGATQESPSGDDLVNDGNLTAIVKIGTNAVVETGIVLSQRSETKFRVQDDPDGAGGNVGVCRLVDKDVPGDNEMVIKGYVNGTGNGVNIRKLHNRTVFDFDNNRYTWEIQDDSTANILVLTAI